MILKSETFDFHGLDLTQQAGFIVTIYDEGGQHLAATALRLTPVDVFTDARHIVEYKIEGHSCRAVWRRHRKIGVEFD
jgi:hypothetical protein